MDIPNLLELRKHLLPGGVKEIAKRAHTSSSAVTQVLQGRYVNYKILEAISEVALEHKSRRTHIIEKLHKVLETRNLDTNSYK